MKETPRGSTADCYACIALCAEASKLFGARGEQKSRKATHIKGLALYFSYISPAVLGLTRRCHILKRTAMCLERWRSPGAPPCWAREEMADPEKSTRARVVVFSVISPISRQLEWEAVGQLAMLSPYSRRIVRCAAWKVLRPSAVDGCSWARPWPQTVLLLLHQEKVEKKKCRSCE
jgi:hypothetical protein